MAKRRFVTTRERAQARGLRRTLNLGDYETFLIKKTLEKLQRCTHKPEAFLIMKEFVRELYAGHKA